MVKTGNSANKVDTNPDEVVELVGELINELLYGTLELAALLYQELLSADTVIAVVVVVFVVVDVVLLILVVVVLARV